MLLPFAMTATDGFNVWRAATQEVLAQHLEEGTGQAANDIGSTCLQQGSRMRKSCCECCRVLSERPSVLGPLLFVTGVFAIFRGIPLGAMFAQQQSEPLSLRA